MFLLLPILTSRLPAQHVPDSVYLPRITAVAHLYNAVRFFHPYLGYQGIDWDGAVAEALPQIILARSRTEYREALARMLAVLDDPATRVIDTATPPASATTRAEPLAARWAGDSALVIRFLPGKNPDFTGLQERLSALDSLIRPAHAVIFDLRAPEGWESRGDVQELLTQSRMSTALLRGPVGLPTERTRVHEGYTPDPPAAAGATLYHAGWEVPSGMVLQGSDSTPVRPLLFLVNARSELPALALGARAAGVGRIIGEGVESRGIGASTATIPLGEGLAVRMRLGELISPEGTSIPTVDTLVTPAADGIDPALEVALRWAASSALPRLKADPLPVSVYPAETPADPEGYPDLGQRLVGLFRVWGAIDYFHAYRDLYREDWEAQLAAAVPTVIGARDSVGYDLAIAELVSHIRDSHGFLSGPGLRAFYGRARLPILARMIEGRAIVTRLLADSLSGGLQVGDEILRIDGEKMSDRLRRLGRYIAASNEWVGQRDALNAALRGPDSSVATLVVRGADSRSRSLRVPRSADFWRLYDSERTGDILRILPGNIGYADLDRLSGDMVDSLFTMFRGTRGIVFDMRGYPKGTAWLIAPRLTDRAQVPAARFRERIARGPRGTSGGEEGDDAVARTFTQYLPAPEGETYRGPTVMLIDERTQSQAEHTGLFFEAANGTRFFGSGTAGANGDVTSVTLPGNLRVWFTGLAVFHADGRPLQQVGLTPDVRVTPSIAGIRAGRDEVLDRALQYLRAGPLHRGTR